MYAHIKLHKCYASAYSTAILTHVYMSCTRLNDAKCKKSIVKVCYITLLMKYVTKIAARQR